MREKFKTPEQCLATVKKDSRALNYALKYIPEDLKTPELCLAAIQQSGEALEYVPEELKDSVV